MFKILPVVIFCIVFITQISAQELNLSLIDQNLLEAINSDPNQDFNIYVVLEDKLDFNQFNSRASYSDVHSKSVAVNKALRSKAKSSQAPLLDNLKVMDGVKENSIKSFWIANAIFFTCDLASIIELSNNTMIQWIGIEGVLLLTEEESSSPSTPMPSTIQTGLKAINAPALWELGYTGYGQIALVADTGIDPNHASYSDRYRGYTTNNSEAWFMGDYYNSETPFNCGDHGTHVLGTVLGLDKITQDTIGVAFNAQWMGSPNLCGGGTGSNLATFEWGADPDDNPNTTEDMADVINNSWWDPGVSNSECNSLYIDVLEALEMMGVAVVFSAGNAGPEVQTITPPHNINFDIVNSFTVAAVSGSDPELSVADFSSRGPSDCGGEGSILIKPEVAAPGVFVRSAVFENAYGNKSGTSMAAPHVSGAILLLKEAFPYLSGRDLKLALYYSCTDLGEEGEDNTYGMGIINVKAAYDYLVDLGNEPLPPLNSNDIVLLDISTNKFECDNQITPEIVFFNNSDRIIESVKIQFIVDDNIQDATVFDWVGMLSPYESETIIIPGFEAESGLHTLTANILEANGEADARTLNNKIKKNVQVSSREQVTAFTNSESSACENANTLLGSDYNGSGVIHWFDSAVKGTLLGEGNQISLEASEDPYFVYADINRKSNIGEVASNSDLESVSNSLFRGLTINAFHPFVIESFKIYSEESGFFLIELVAGNDDVITSELLRSDGSGWQTIEERIVVQEARNLRLVLADGQPKLGRYFQNTSYPYVIEDIMEISSSVVDGNEVFNQYHYFFDLEISHYDVCGRTPIEVTAVPTDSIPLADFTIGNENTSFDISEALILNDASTNVQERLWDFGDGNTSTEVSPSHTYEEAGVYFVSLTVFNEDNCYDSKVVEVEVISSSLSSLKDVTIDAFDLWIYPNPAKDLLYVRTDKDFQTNLIRIYDNTGLLVLEKTSFDGEDIDLNIKMFPPGLYYLKAAVGDNFVTKKFVKY